MEVARVQDSATGVFLSADSLISQPGYTQSYNRYGYVNNNPLCYNDPSGHCPSNNGTTPPDNNGPGYELEEVVVYGYIDDSRSANSSSWDFTPFDWNLLRDWYNDYFNNNNVDSAPAKRAPQPVPQTQKTGQCLADAQKWINGASGLVGGFVGTYVATGGNLGLALLGGGAAALASALADSSPGTSGSVLSMALIATASALSTVAAGDGGARWQALAAAGGQGWGSVVYSGQSTSTAGRVAGYGAGSLIGGVTAGYTADLIAEAMGARQGMLGTAGGVAGALAGTATNAVGQGIASLLCQ